VSDQFDALNEALSVAHQIPVEAYISPEYARREQTHLWRKVWQVAGRCEDLPGPGSFLTYDILEDSIIVVRDDDNQLRAYFNACPHRGRKLIDIPEGERYVRGRRSQFVCGFHGWRFDFAGNNTFMAEAQDWQGKVDSACAGLTPVQVDTWGGWIWINMDPEAGSLRDYLEPAASLLDPFALDKMRCRWRKWGVFDCNWKVALEAFNETYHVATTHPEFNQFGGFRGWSKAQGRHSNIGYEAPKDMDKNQQAKLRVGEGADPRVATAAMQRYTWDKANTNTTETLVAVAERLVDELPEGTPATEVLQYWLKTAREEDAARGVHWAEVDADTVGKSGTAWQLFPNFQIGHSVNNMLCYNARPYQGDPDRCIFEAAVYQLYPEGQEPETEWEYCPPTEEAWCYVLSQDFSNMRAVQQGMKSPGFGGPRPNPYMERSTVNLHRNLAELMGSGHPVPIE
jgi:phenylpropionate dioxygenase-like ring-hydroxylating dioxygenase large terminal subunit